MDIRDVGDPVELGAYYASQGADELVFLDITATHEGRKTFTELVKRIAREINIPFTVGEASVSCVMRVPIWPPGPTRSASTPRQSGIPG